MSAWEVDEPPAALDRMQSITPLLKYGRQGNPHFRNFQLSGDLTVLKWYTTKQKKQPTEVRVEDMIRVVEGQQSEIFQRNKTKEHPKHLSFSLYYHLPDSNKEVTLDVVCRDEDDYTTWTTGLRWLIAHKYDLHRTFTNIDDALARQILSDDDPPARDLETTKVNVNTTEMAAKMQEHTDLYTWGSDLWGQLGVADGVETLKEEMQPKLVRELVHKDADIVFVGCGEAHTVAVARDGKAYSWGHSGNGRLGLTLPNINDHVLVPMLITSLNTHRIIAAACGAMHTLFLSENGELFSCGNNMFGQLGVGDKDGRNTPVPVLVPSQSTVKPHHSAIAAGQMCSAAILTVGGQAQALYTWGGNHFGVLGLGENTQETLLPTAVGSIQQDWLIKAIAIGDFHMCAIADFIGTESGDDITTTAPPTRQRSMSSLANSDTDRVLSWGWNGCGQLGHGNQEDRYLPEPINFLKGKLCSQISCGSAHTAAVVTVQHMRGEMLEGQLFYWGNGLASPSAQSDTPHVLVPSHFTIRSAEPGAAAEGIAKELPVVKVACGETHTLALTDTGQLRMLGRNPFDSSIGEEWVGDLADKDLKGIASGTRHFACLIGRKWVEDAEAVKCMQCTAVFTTIRRRHHCRNCGGIFCGACTRKRAPVLKYGFSEKVRVCDKCYIQITRMN